MSCLRQAGFQTPPASEMRELYTIYEKIARIRIAVKRILQESIDKTADSLIIDAKSL